MSPQPTFVHLARTGCYLLDGPITSLVQQREAIVERMAAELLRQGTWGNPRSAVSSLLGNGFAAIDIALLVDDARQKAVQEVVAKEMGAS